MEPASRLYSHDALADEIVNQFRNYPLNIKFSPKTERKILKVFLLGRLHQLFCEIFQSKIQNNQNNSLVESYVMDSKIIQFLLQGIVETGEYTLEGIAYVTHIPFDVIYEAACGISNQFSITPWAKVVDLYLQVKPDITKVLIDKLLEIKNNNCMGLLSLLTET